MMLVLRQVCCMAGKTTVKSKGFVFWIHVFGTGLVFSRGIYNYVGLMEGRSLNACLDRSI